MKGKTNRGKKELEGKKNRKMGYEFNNSNANINKMTFSFSDVSQNISVKKIKNRKRIDSEVKTSDYE